ncbi:MAG TPA: hydroxymethylbilane synthase [Paludibacter sp.]|nr:hydroxymethylbilane synthase [Paludibacter sp.]
MSRKFIVATRPSLLAYTQTQQTVDVLKRENPDCEFEIIKISTHGDAVANKPLTAFGGTGVFVKELENALYEGVADFAVHSLKDVPSTQPDGLVLAAFPVRQDARDVVLTRQGTGLQNLGGGCKIGTGSPRRMVQVAAMKPDAVFTDLRGNIDTRLQKLEDGQYDAIVLAAAGLKRLGKPVEESAILPMDVCIPAVGQGAIAVECRADDTETIALLKTINDPATEVAVLAERSYMKTIGGGCKFPLGAYATVNADKVTLQVMLGNHFTGQIIRMGRTAPVTEAGELGRELGEAIIREAGKQGIEILR